MFLADFHVHSNFSDGRHPIPELVDYFGSLGFGAIAITDHLCENQSVVGKASAYLGCTLTPASFPLYLEILKTEAERAWDKYRMVVIPGVELTKNSLLNHRSAHILALGTRQWISANPDLPEICSSIKGAGGLSVAAHPVWTRKMEKQTYEIWDRREELAGSFDAWEVASGPYLFEEVRRTKLPKIASSDLHVKKQMTSWKTLLQCERKEEAILEAIRRQEIDFRYYEAPHELDVRHAVLPLGPGHRSGHLGDLDFPQAS